MELTAKQCDLLIDMFNASIANASRSGIPIGKEYYNDLDKIREELYKKKVKINQEACCTHGTNS